MYMCVYTSAGSLSLLLTKLWDHHCSFQTVSITSRRKKPHAPLFLPPPPPPSTFDTDSRFLNSLASPAMFPNTGAPQTPPPRQRTPLIQALPGCSNTWNGGGGGEGRLLCWESGGGRHGTQKHSESPSLCLSSIWGFLRCIL